MAVIKIKNLRKYFGKTRAVDNISFEVKEGEIVGFLGPNGAGKTTTIRCMMDFSRPNSGTVEIFGLSANKHASQIMKDVGYLSSESTLYDSWTGKEHIDFIESIRGKSDLDEKLIKNLRYDIRKKAKALSTGNKRKLSIILALISSPKLLILDEPTVGLDPLLQNYIYEVLRAQVKEGRTVFMSSHNLAEVEKICSRVIVLKDGKVVATERVNDLRTKKIYSVQAFFDGEIPKKDLLSGSTELLQEFPDGISLKVKGDIKPIISKLSSLKNLKDVQISHANLEEVFMEFYK